MWQSWNEFSCSHLHFLKFVYVFPEIMASKHVHAQFLVRPTYCFIPRYKQFIFLYVIFP